MEIELSLYDVLTLVFVLIGTAFMLIAALGILRMPDLFLRMSMTTKAATLGVGTMLVACIVYFRDPDVTTRAGATILFIFLTASAAAHMIGRAGYLDPEVTLWEKTHHDDLKARYAYKGNKRHLQSAHDGELKTINAADLEADEA